MTSARSNADPRPALGTESLRGSLPISLPSPTTLPSKRPIVAGCIKRGLAGPRLAGGREL